MAEGQVAQAFGGRTQTDAAFKTDDHLSVKVFLRPGSFFCRDLERWVKDEKITEIVSSSLTNFDGQVAYVVWYRTIPAVRQSDLIRDTASLLLQVVERLDHLTQLVHSPKNVHTHPE